MQADAPEFVPSDTLQKSLDQSTSGQPSASSSSQKGAASSAKKRAIPSTQPNVAKVRLRPRSFHLFIHFES